MPVWFAGDESRPLMVFAGIWTNWTSVRKTKEGEVNADLYGFLTTEPNTVVGDIHPKAMPVILTEPEETTCGCRPNGQRQVHYSSHCRTTCFRLWRGG